MQPLLVRNMLAVLGQPEVLLEELQAVLGLQVVPNAPLQVIDRFVVPCRDRCLPSTRRSFFLHRERHVPGELGLLSGPRRELCLLRGPLRHC